MYSSDFSRTNEGNASVEVLEITEGHLPNRYSSNKASFEHVRTQGIPYSCFLSERYIKG